MTFSKLGVSKSLQEALNLKGIHNPTPIQEAGIPAILEQKDILGIAKTGSGKTLSYVLPMLSRFEGKPNRKNRHLQSLILVPTRELAIQIGGIVKEYSERLSQPIKSMAVYGGVSINPQMKNMIGVQILIATPGRLLDLVDSNAMRFVDLQMFVLDEADKMLNLGFQDEVSQIISLLPEKRQNLLFSATLSPDLAGISEVIQEDPLVIKVDDEEEAALQIQQQGYFVSDERKGPLLRYLIKRNSLKKLLVFTSSAKRADRVSAKLIKNGIEALPIHGKKSQAARQSALQQFKEGKIDVLVTTDLLSRGIDIDRLPLVVNYELPRSPKDFIHRIGRTGRAGEIGNVITFVAREETKHFKMILKKMKVYIDVEDTEDWDLLHGLDK